MNSLSSTAEEILELCGRGAAHPDPKVCCQILITDIENALHRSEFGREFHQKIHECNCEIREKEAEIEDLEDRVAELESDIEEAKRRVAIMESNP